MQSMFKAGVVDEVHVRVCPTTRGKGVPVFEERYDMQLIKAESFENGVVILQYKMK
jgi:dihydrofolate reductase